MPELGFVVSSRGGGLYDGHLVAPSGAAKPTSLEELVVSLPPTHRELLHVRGGRGAAAGIGVGVGVGAGAGRRGRGGCAFREARPAAAAPRGALPLVLQGCGRTAADCESIC